MEGLVSSEDPRSHLYGCLQHCAEAIEFNIGTVFSKRSARNCLEMRCHKKILGFLSFSYSSCHRVLNWRFPGSPCLAVSTTVLKRVQHSHIGTWHKKQMIAYQTTISKLVQLFWVTAERFIYLFIIIIIIIFEVHTATQGHGGQGLWDPTAAAKASHRAMEGLWVNLTHYTNASNVCSTARKSRSYGEFPMPNWL